MTEGKNTDCWQKKGTRKGDKIEKILEYTQNISEIYARW